MGQESFPEVEAAGYTWAGGSGGSQAAAGERGGRCGVRRCPAREPLDPLPSLRSAHRGRAALQAPLPLWRPHVPLLHVGGKRPQEVVGPSWEGGRPAGTEHQPPPQVPTAPVHPPPSLLQPEPLHSREGRGGCDSGRAPEWPAGHPARGAGRGGGAGGKVSGLGLTCLLTPRCATTHNYDRDRAWGYCAQVSVPREGPGGCWRRGGGRVGGGGVLVLGWGVSKGMLGSTC